MKILNAPKPLLHGIGQKGGAVPGTTTLPEGPHHLPHGVHLLRDPLLNKGTAFTLEEREALGLSGLLPPRVDSMQDQIQRIIGNVRKKPNDIERYNYLIGLSDRNRTLFYRILMDNLIELMPIVYTPTIGYACQAYGHIFRRSQGLYVSERDRGNIRNIVSNWPMDDVRVIVVTDGERILGLGDLGANGMGIPIGKLSLYTACAGVRPEYCLPVMFDVGTDNLALLEDPLYLGLPQRRLRGEAYDSLFAEFIEAVTERFPNLLVQLEDFGNTNAFRLLDHYREKICVFNDDIQGTAAVALAGLYSALKLTQGKLSEQTVVLFGAGEAATGITELIAHGMMEEGLTESEAQGRLWLIDSKGLVVASRTGLAHHKLPYAHDHEPLSDLISVVKALRPAVLIGASSQPGAFSREVLETMASYQEHPVVFALSNPTSQSECTAEEAYSYTNGRVIFASGSPFPDVVIDGKLHAPGQANNAYIFPGMGLGIIASRAKRVTTEMFYVAARALVEQVAPADLAKGRIYPSLNRVRQVSLKIAEAVAGVVFDRKLNGIPEPSDIAAFIAREVYEPKYQSYV